MDDLAEVQQAIAASDAPASEFLGLSRTRQREVFFHLPRALQESVIEDMEREHLQSLARRLDPDEVADILELADEQTREEVLRRLDEDHRERVEFLLGFTPGECCRSDEPRLHHRRERQITGGRRKARAPLRGAIREVSHHLRHRRR